MIKICGITDAMFAQEAEALGVDYLGFIFYEKSPRNLTDQRAELIVKSLIGTAKRVGVFVDAAVDEIVRKAEKFGFSMIQLHGEYSVDDVLQLKRKGFEVWKSVHDEVPVGIPADGFVIDAKVGGMTGGTGQKSDWGLVAKVHETGAKAILAGGISAENLKDALATGCDIVDVNSSLEISPGVKTRSKLYSLMKVLKEAI